MLKFGSEGFDPYHISCGDHIPLDTRFRGDYSKQSIILRYLQTKGLGIVIEGGNNG